jgi:acyl dehydratase
MLEVETLAELQPLVGQHLGSSAWMLVDQALIDDFARVSGDRNWVHVDVARARKELPDGKTIAHGMLTLSLVTHLASTILQVRQRSKGINYGSNKVRFINPVQCGARIRLHRSLKSVEPIDGGARLTFFNEVEIENQAKPAMVAETISVIYAGEVAAP